MVAKSGLQQQERPLFVYSDRSVARNFMLGFLVIFVVLGFFLFPEWFISGNASIVLVALTFVFGMYVVGAFVVLLSSPKYEFYSGSIEIEENLFSTSPPYKIGYDKIQYCRPIYSDSLIASFLGEQRPKSLDDFTVMEIKLLFGEKRFIVRANPKLQEPKVDLYHFINQRMRKTRSDPQLLHTNRSRLQAL
ncbi:MAG: hypothetical protein PXY39_15095 [archaeon]|nr:hypothetical protein [archaeon]